MILQIKYSLTIWAGAQVCIVGFQGGGIEVELAACGKCDFTSQRASPLSDIAGIILKIPAILLIRDGDNSKPVLQA